MLHIKTHRWILGLGVAATLLPQIATAQTVYPALQSVTSSMTFITGFLITAMNATMWLLFWLLSIILRPDFIFGGDAGAAAAGGAGGGIFEMLHQIWMVARDLVNIAFVFVLLAGAIMVTVTAKKDSLSKFPQFVAAVILVNFSWFVPQVVIDVGNVLAATVYNLPAMIGDSAVKCENIEFDQNLVKQAPKPCEMVTKIAFFEQIQKQGIVERPQGATSGWVCPARDIFCYETREMTEEDLSTGLGIINGLVVNQAQLRSYTTQTVLAGQAPKGVNATIILWMKMSFVLLLHIALFFPLLALVAAFFLRVPVLWITMAFMPFVALGAVIGDRIPGLDITKKIWKNFLSAALLPAYVGIPLAIGYIMINAGLQLDPGAGGGAAGNLATTGIPLFAGVNSMWQLMWLIMAIGVMWVGVFNVLKQQEFSARITGSIESFGKTLGNIALKAPLSVPIMPAPGGAKGESVSLLQLSKLPRRIESSLDNLGTLGLGGGKKGDKEEVKQTLTQNTTVNNYIKTKLPDSLNGASTPKDQAEALNKFTQYIRDNSDLKTATDSQIIEELRKMNLLTDENLKKLEDGLRYKEGRGGSPGSPP